MGEHLYFLNIEYSDFNLGQYFVKDRVFIVWEHFMAEYELIKEVDSITIILIMVMLLFVSAGLLLSLAMKCFRLKKYLVDLIIAKFSKVAFKTFSSLLNLRHSSVGAKLMARMRFIEYAISINCFFPAVLII